MTRRIHVILSGGHMLGVVLHAGALSELHRQCKERGWEIAGVGGLSAGALVAAAYASGHDVQEDHGLEHIVREHILASGKYRRAQNDGEPQPICEPDWPGFVRTCQAGGAYPRLYPTGRIWKVLHRAVQRDIDSVRGDLRIVTTNTHTAQAAIWAKGDEGPMPDLHDLVLASMAIPLAFPPVDLVGTIHVDGALSVGNTPWRLWDDVAEPADIVVLRMGRLGTTKAPPRDVVGYTEAMIDVMGDALEWAHKDSLHPMTVVNLPAFGRSDNFEMSRQDADHLMLSATRRVQDAFRERGW